MHYHLEYSDPMFSGVILRISNQRGDYVRYVVGANDGGSCKGGTFHSHKKIFGILNKVAVHIQIQIRINKGSGTLEMKDNTLAFASGYKAKYELLKSFEPQHGFNFWDRVVPENNYNRLQIYVVYQGIARKPIDNNNIEDPRTIFVVKDAGLERDFPIEARGNTTVCGSKAYATSSINLFVIESSNGMFAVKLKHLTNPRNFNLKLMNSMKIAHLSHDVRRQLAEMYADLMFEKCLTDSKVLMNMMALAKVDPAD